MAGGGLEHPELLSPKICAGRDDFLRHAGGISSSGTATLRNVTVSGNRSDFGAGGIRNDGVLDGANLTVTENTGPEAGGIYNASGRLVLANSIVAGNRGPGAPDCGGVLATLGNNLVGSAIGCVLDGNVEGDRIGVDPLLAILRNNGGPTHTHGLQQGSAAIDARAACELTDQRGVPRPHGAACDSGAVEETINCGNGAIDPPEECDDGDGNCAVNPADLAATGAVLFR